MYLPQYLTAVLKIHNSVYITGKGAGAADPLQAAPNAVNNRAGVRLAGAANGTRCALAWICCRSRRRK
jgi:hypothetical protein